MTQKGIEPQTPRRDSEILPLHQGYYLPYLTFTYSPSEKWPKKGFRVFENFCDFVSKFLFFSRVPVKPHHPGTIKNIKND